MSSDNASSQTPPKGLIAWFADNSVAANLLMLFLIIGGVIATSSMRTETFPAIDPKIITVTVPYPGATPYEVEDAITSRVEEAVQGIEGIKRITSTANEGAGTVTIELQDFVDGSTVRDDVETEVSRLPDFPPEAAEQPIIIKAKPQPIVMTLVLYGELADTRLKYWAEKLKDEMTKLDGVSLITMEGIPNYEISIQVNERSLQSYGLTLQEVAQQVRRFSQNIPAGTVESQNGDVLLRVQEKGEVGADFTDMIIRSQTDGSLIRLGDIATIRDTMEDVNLSASYNGEPAVFININRSEDQDTLTVEGTVQQYLSDVQLPEGLQLKVWRSETESLKDRINLLLRNGILGFALLFLVLLLFLDLRLAVWTSLGVPISFMGGILIMYGYGLSINMITLFALIIVLGIVVDDAIVVGESIFNRQSKGERGVKSVINGVKDVFAPVSIGVLTTVAAFAPLAFSTGTLGQILKVIPVAVISILLVSLAEAYLILPSHLSHAKGDGYWSAGIMRRIGDKFSNGLETFVERYLTPAVKLVLRFRYAALAAFIAMLILTVGLFTGGIMRFVFFPPVEGDEVTVQLVMPVGTPFDITKRNAEIMLKAAQEVEQDLDGEKLYEGIGLILGATTSDTGPGTSSTSNEGNTAELRLRLIDSTVRPIGASTVEDRLREKIGTIPGADEVAYESSLVRAGNDINIELTHPDNDSLEKATKRLKQKMQAIPGITDLAVRPKDGKREYLFELTNAGLAAGLTPESLGGQLRAAFYGIEVQRLQRQGVEFKVMVHYPSDARDSLATLEQTRIRTATGEELALQDVATITPQRGFASIRRSNGQRITAVTADTITSQLTPDEAIKVIFNDLIPNIKQDYPNLEATLEGESRDRQEDLASLGKNMAIGVMIIFLLLGSLLRSYAQPIIILLVVPFGVVGAVLGHLLLGYNMTFISMFGIVALTGVIINDSVVMIDYYNQQRRNGEPIESAMLLALQRRFRPILLTTMTTTLGLLPMLLETSLQARFLIPMVISLAFGLLFGTLIILFLVPTLTLIADDIRQGSIWVKQKVFG